ncbi:hypothetical protein ACQJBY_046698 [Aegilops geniculata]
MALIRSLLVLLLLLCPADASGTSAPAQAPATGLEAEKFCLGIGTRNQALACMANVAASCLAMSAAADAGLGSQCLAAGPAQHGKEEEHCIGIGISKERMTCLALVGWSCQGSRFGDVGLTACFLTSSMKCIV